jgi:hypothetical protein
MGNGSEKEMPPQSERLAEGMRRIADALEESEAGQETVLGQAARSLRKHPAIAVTLAYLYVSTIGVVYLWGLFTAFGLNVMDFAETNDFLLAAFKEPRVFAYAVGITLFSLSSLAWWVRSRRLWAERRKAPVPDIERGVYAAVVGYCIVGTFVAPVVFSWFISRGIKAGDADKVVVELRSGAGQAIASCLDGDLFLLGTTEKFAFFYDRNDQNQPRNHVIPISNIVQIHHLPKGSSWACPAPSPTSILWEIEAEEGASQALFTRDVLTRESCEDCVVGPLQPATILRPMPDGCEQAAWDPGSEWTYCHVEVLTGDLAGEYGWVNASHVGKR